MDSGWNPNLLLPIQRTFLFIEGERPEAVPAGYVAGRKSRLFLDMTKHARLERRDDIFVPFLNETLMSFEEQKRRIEIANPFGPGTYGESSAIQTAERFLLEPRSVPSEVLEGTA